MRLILVAALWAGCSNGGRGGDGGVPLDFAVPAGDLAGARDLAAGGSDGGGALFMPLVNPAPGNTLRGAWGSGANDVYLVGDGGTVLHSTDGNTFAVESSSTTANLRAVLGTANSGVWAVGDGGVVIVRSNGTWQAAASPTALPLAAVWGAGAQLFIGGGDGNGQALFSSGDGGKSWAPLSLPSSGPIYALGGTAGNDLFAGGIFSKTIFHSGDDGASWSAGAVTSIGFTSAIAAYGPGEAIAVGEYDATNYTSDGGKTWQARPTGSSGCCNAVWQGAIGTYGAGAGAKVMRSGDKGLSWSTTQIGELDPDLGSPLELFAIWGASAGPVFVAGQDGAIWKGM